MTGHHPAALRGNVAFYLHIRLDQLGTLPDLNEALALRRTILEFHPHGHPERSTALSNLANVLHSRFKRLQTLPDLEEALTLERSAPRSSTLTG
ncbi:hypothetical protein V8E55_010150 [Tylopilus felleus]